ncbi:MAG: integrin alpha [Candidatus Helarchaeota archaeon]
MIKQKTNFYIGVLFIFSILLQNCIFLISFGRNLCQEPIIYSNEISNYICLFQIQGLNIGTNLGYEFSANGDYNGDLITDLLITDLLEKKILLYDGATILNERRNVIIQDASASTSFGRTIEFIGDINNDTYCDFIVSDIEYNSGSGRIYLFFGNETSLFNSNDNVTIDGEEVGAYFGSSVSSAGDINTDGFNDFIISAPCSTVGSYSEAGKAFVFFGNSSGFLHRTFLDEEI